MGMIRKLEKLAERAGGTHRKMFDSKMRVAEYPIRYKVFKVKEAAALLLIVLDSLSIGNTDVEIELEIVEKQVDSLK